MDDDEWLERLRRVVTEANVDVDDRSVAGGMAEPALPRATVRSDPDLGAVVTALRNLEQRVAAVDHRLRQLNDDHDRLVAEVADAVVARLDARWARSLAEDLGGPPRT